jgi:hypothetical protein
MHLYIVKVVNVIADMSTQKMAKTSNAVSCRLLFSFHYYHAVPSSYLKFSTPFPHRSCRQVMVLLVSGLLVVIFFW